VVVPKKKGYGGEFRHKYTSAFGDLGAAVLTAVAAAAVLNFWEVVANRALLDQVALSSPFVFLVGFGDSVFFLEYEYGGIRILTSAIIPLLCTSIYAKSNIFSRSKAACIPYMRDPIVYLFSKMEMNVRIHYFILPWKPKEYQLPNKSILHYKKLLLLEFTDWYVAASLLCNPETLQETGAHNCWISVFPYVALVQVIRISRIVFSFRPSVTVFLTIFSQPLQFR
jgi:hypothetical protein